MGTNTKYKSFPDISSPSQWPCLRSISLFSQGYVECKYLRSKAITQEVSRGAAALFCHKRMEAVAKDQSQY